MVSGADVSAKFWLIILHDYRFVFVVQFCVYGWHEVILLGKLTLFRMTNTNAWILIIKFVDYILAIVLFFAHHVLYLKYTIWAIKKSQSTRNPIPDIIFEGVLANLALTMLYCESTRSSLIRNFNFLPENPIG